MDVDELKQKRRELLDQMLSPEQRVNDPDGGGVTFRSTEEMRAQLQQIEKEIAALEGRPRRRGYLTKFRSGL